MKEEKAEKSSKNGLLSKETGFTLIEIISVLVILGILAAVALPRFVDLQDDARQKAAQAAIAEAKARCSQIFAQQLLASNGNTGAVNSTTVYTEMLTDTNYGDFTVTITDGSTGINISVDTVQGVAINANNTANWITP